VAGTCERGSKPSGTMEAMEGWLAERSTLVHGVILVSLLTVTESLLGVTTGIF
jgi:hypothetical protein